MYGRAIFVVAGCVSLVARSPMFAQASPLHDGSWLVAGSASLTRNHSDDGGGTSTHASLVPTGLRFINEHFAIGGTLLLAYDDFGSENAVTYGIGPAARFYPSPATNWKPFLAASIAPEWQTFSIPSQPDANQTLLGIEGSFGLTRMLATHVGLDGELFYRHSHQTSKIAATSVSRNVDSYGLRFGLSVFID